MNKITLLLAPLLILSGLYAGKGKIRVASDKQGAYVYVDGKKKAMTGEGFTSILLEEGNHEVLVKKDIDKYHSYFANKNIFVGEETSIKENFILKEGLKPSIEKKWKLYESNYIKKYRNFYLNKYKRWVRKNNLVIDKNLGIEWQDNKRETEKKNWKDANDYCNNLRLSKQDDWRLPSYNELLSIVDYTRDFPALIPAFKFSHGEHTWTSSNVISDPKSKYYISFINGKSNINKMIYKNYVTCVRGGGKNKNKKINHLEWQDNIESSKIKLDWEEALNYCKNLTLHSKTNWRLPSVEDYRSIVDVTQYNPAVKNNFKYFSGSMYWTSSPRIHFIGTVNLAWEFSIKYGIFYPADKTKTRYVKCVSDK